MERALIGEVIDAWSEKRLFKYDSAPDAIRRERGLIQDCDFDLRVLNLCDEIFAAYSNDNSKLWLRQINRSKNLISAVNDTATNNSFSYILLIDRLDESWDGSDSAIICLMALMHATVRLIAATNGVIKPYIFIRENIYDRIRAVDNEFSRLETSVVFLDWTPEKLTELVERRLVKPFNTKPKLNEAWPYFFEDSDSFNSMSRIMTLCQHRPRDVLMLVSYSIDSAVSRNNIKVTEDDIVSASKRYSTSRLKDLGDEYAENFSNVSIVLGYFFGLTTEYTFAALDAFIALLLVDSGVQKYCKGWFYNHSTPHAFIDLLFSIGFLGIKSQKRITYKDSSVDSNAKSRFDSSSIFLIHPTYHEALNLRASLLTDLSDETMLKNEGILEDLPESFDLDEYKKQIDVTRDHLSSISAGKNGAKEYEDVIGEVIKLCFFRSLTNVQPKERSADGAVIRDWIASNRARDGFWEIVRNMYDANQIIWECKNYENLHADDFHQMSYYLNDVSGRFGIIVFRGNEIKDSYLKHLKRAVVKHGLIMILTEKDIEVFLRQASKGTFKELHIQDRFDYFVRKLS